MLTCNLHVRWWLKKSLNIVKVRTYVVEFCTDFKATTTNIQVLLILRVTVDNCVLKKLSSRKIL